MRIKNAEGQTLLTLLKVCIAFAACLSVGNMHAYAEATFAFFNNIESFARDFISDGSDDYTLPGTPVRLFYEETSGKITSYIYQQYYLVGEEPRLGLVDASRKQLVPEQYEGIVLLPHAYVLKSGGSWAFYDQASLVALNDERWDKVTVEYDHKGCIYGDRVTVERGGLKGAVDLLGAVVIEPLYDEFQLYAQEVGWPLILVKYNGYYGFLDTDGQVVIDVTYDYAVLDNVIEYADENDAEGTEAPIIYVLKNGEWGAIRRNEDGSPSKVDWTVNPTEEVAAAYARLP